MKAAQVHAKVPAGVKPAFSTAPASLLQRACDCQASPLLTAAGALGLKDGLKVSRPGDVWEQEAERVAQSVLDGSSGKRNRGRRGGTPDGRSLMRQAGGPAPASVQATPQVQAVLASPGRPLEAGTRAFMEAGFGHDFGRVRIHDDRPSAQSASQVGALAYTVADHIVFAAGQYTPGTADGRRLLAHELVHTLQQGGWLRRTPDAATLQTFDQRARDIRALPAFRALAPEHQAVANDIIRVARTRDNCLYYIDKLTLLFNTPDAPRADVAQATAQVAGEDVSEEQARLVTPEGQRRQGIEEATAGASGRRWAHRRGEGGVTYDVDARDPNNIVVQLRVHLVPRGRGTRDDVARIRSMEDAIEKNASTSGYTVNLIFVDRSGPDVFTVGVDPSQWETSGNWVADPLALAHETHHLLGLPDRYDYIEAHAANADMVMTDRLHWFREQLNRAPDPHGEESIMGSGAHPLDDDICRVAGLDQATCVGARQARTGEIRNARMMAFGRAFRAQETLAATRPASPVDRPGYPSANAQAQEGAVRTARNIFGSDVSADDLLSTVLTIRNRVSPAMQAEVVPEADSRCSADVSYVTLVPPTVRLCPQFFQQPVGERVETLLRAGADQALGIDGTSDTACGAGGCDAACGGVNNGFAWARFINCLSGAGSAAAQPGPVIVPPFSQGTPVTP